MNALKQRDSTEWPLVLMHTIIVFRIIVYEYSVKQKAINKISNTKIIVEYVLKCHPIILGTITNLCTQVYLLVNI